MASELNRRNFLKGSLGLALGATASGRAAAAAPKRARNLLFVIIDDWNAQVAGSYGNPIVRTPHFDAFAARSVRFARAYCQAPICNPSRTSFVTGLRPDTTQVYRNQDPMDQRLPAGTTSLPELFADAGSYTVNVGKLFHGASMASAQMRRFDRIELTPKPAGYAGVSTGYPDAPPYVPLELRVTADSARLRRKLSEVRARRDALALDDPARRQAQLAVRAYESGLMGDSGESEQASSDGQRARLAAQILRERAREARPFLLCVGLGKPHSPLLAPKPYVDLYDPAELPLPAAPVGQDRGIPPVARRHGTNYEVFNFLDATPSRARKAIASYYACVSFIDAQLGIVLEALEASGLADETVVMIFADHGFHLGEHGLWGKSTLFEQSTRVPLLVRVPGAPGNGQACDAIVELVDLLPTICELFAFAPPQRFEGSSLAPLLAAPGRRWKPAAFTICGGLQGRSVRTRRYCYSEWAQEGQSLHDLEDDPWEQRNAIAQPGYRSVLAEHRALLRSGWRAALPPEPRPSQGIQGSPAR